MPNTTTPLSTQPTSYVNEGSVSPEQLRQTTGHGWIEIRKPQAEIPPSNTTSGVIPFNQSFPSLEDPRATIRTAKEQGGYSMADYAQRFREAMSSSKE